ncbi:hypothetical protein WJX79_000447 [Trebouxia sp. C0005]
MQLPNLVGGSVVITGGGGMIGSLVSQWILKEGEPRSVKLLSRTGRASPERTIAILGCPEARAGAMISIAMCDVSISEDSRHCFDSEYNQNLPITAIIHAGGVLSDATVGNQTPAGMRAVFAPKAPSLVLGQVADAVASVLGSSVAADASLMEVGLDSLGAVELRNALSQQFELDLPATFTFDYPSVQAMSGFISSLLGEPGNDVGMVEQLVVGQPQSDQRLVVASRLDNRRDMQAITGLSVRFASIDSMGDLHRCLVSQHELQTVAPSSRWDTESIFDPLPSPGQVCSRFGTYVESTYAFDSAVFGLQPNEALLMDPQQRLLLEETLSAFHDANYSAVDMSGSSTGVFLGCMWVEYPDLLMKHGLTSGAYTVTGNGLAFLAGRVRALAVDGRCKSFGAEGDGYGRGEGYTAVLLEPMGTDNERAGQVKAVLMGSAVNQDGRSGGLTAPHGPSQQALITSAMQRAGVSFLPYVSSHGTGTPLGDPIETGALRKAIAPDMAGTGSQLQQRSDPPLRFRNLNPYVGESVSTHTTHFSASLTALPQPMSTKPGDTGSAQQAVVRALGLWQEEAVTEPVGGAVASVAVEQAEDACSYWVHPAALDSCLQLGAVVPEQRQDSGDFHEGISFVPVGAKLFHVPQKLALGEQLASSASIGSGLGDLAGLDSLGAVELKNALETHLGLELPSTLIFDYPSVNAIADYVNSIMPMAAHHDLAATEQQQQLSMPALSSSSQQLSGTRTAVAIGIASAEYNNYVVSRHSPGVEVYSATGGALSVASGRLSYTFGLKGPAMSVDTACSSSLVAAHLVMTHLSSKAVSAGLLHGTGTPLGDPVELGAIRAVLMGSSQRAVPLQVAAAKSWVGHTEAASGVMGLLQAAVGLQQLTAPGTNAHIIQEQGPLIGKLQRQTLALPLAWQRQRHWVVPPVSTLINGAISSAALGVTGGHSRSGVVMLEVDLTSSRAAFLRDYSLMQHTVLPAAGFVELCSSAAAMLSVDKDVSGLVIKDAVLPALLPLIHRKHGANKVHIMIDTLRGSVKVSSVSSDSRQSLHLTASISRLANTASPTSSIPATQQLPAAWKLLVLVSPSAHQEVSSAAVMAEVHQPLHTASKAEVTITRTDASLQLAGLEVVSSHHQMMAANAAKWDAVQFSAAASDAQLHAVATTQQAGQQRVVSSTLLCGPAASLSMQASGRLAFAFGLQGPTASIDTACSASLVAAHMACQSFRDRSVEGALVAGVLLCLVPQSTGMLQRAGMIAPDGRCKTLDAAADGYVRAETCRAMYLMPPHSQGMSSGVTTLGAMHSNGTPLGDPIEVGAAGAVLLQVILSFQV